MHSRWMLRCFLPLHAVIAVLGFAAPSNAGTVCDPKGPWRQELLLGGYAQDVEAVAWSPDGSQVAAGANDGALALFDSRTGEELLTFSTRARVIASVAWSPDGAQLASGAGGGLGEHLRDLGHRERGTHP